MGVTLSEKAYAGNLQFLGGTDPGYIQNILGLAPNRSGTLYGLTNGFGNISGYFVPEIKRHLVSDETSISEWRWLFVLTAAIYCTFMTIFSVAASGNVQAFNSKAYKGVTQQPTSQATSSFSSQFS